MENNTTKTEKTLVDGLWIKSHKFADGSEILKVSVLASKFGDFVKKHVKEDGFINIVITPKREPNEKQTHYSYLDTWRPKTSESTNTATKSSAKPVAKKETVPTENDDNSGF